MVFGQVHSFILFFWFIDSLKLRIGDTWLPYRFHTIFFTLRRIRHTVKKMYRNHATPKFCMYMSHTNSDLFLTYHPINDNIFEKQLVQPHKKFIITLRSVKTKNDPRKIPNKTSLIFFLYLHVFVFLADRSLSTFSEYWCLTNKTVIWTWFTSQLPCYLLRTATSTESFHFRGSRCFEKSSTAAAVFSGISVWGG